MDGYDRGVDLMLMRYSTLEEPFILLQSNNQMLYRTFFFFFFKKNIHKVVELYCFLLLRYNQNNFFVHQAMQMKVEEIAKFF